MNVELSWARLRHWMASRISRAIGIGVSLAAVLAVVAVALEMMRH